MTALLCIIGYLFIALFTWSLCRIATDADRRIENERHNLP